MQCPYCQSTQLQPLTLDDLNLDRCPACHGVWVAMLELERLVRKDVRPLLALNGKAASGANNGNGAAHPAEKKRPGCPRCRGTTYLIKLNSRLRPGLVVDNCKVCFGAWLDAGALARLGQRGLWGRLRSLFKR